MTHTPGPWEAVGQAVYSETPQDVDHSRYFGYSERGPHGFLIAESIPHEATARLIAAAPELLAALERLVMDGYSEENEDLALAAMAKAKGE